MLRPKSFRTHVSLPLCAAVLTASCGAGAESGAGSNGEHEVVTVFAAASLSDVFVEMERSIEQAHPSIDVRLSFAGSSALREQILDGAPADVFASANERVMIDVVDAGLATESEVFATNRLVIAVALESEMLVAGLSDFSRPELLLGACAVEVPCGSAARDVFAAAGIEASLDTEEPDVRRLLAKIVDGELDAGLVYATDADSAGESIVAVGLDENASATNYVVAALSDSQAPEAAAIVVDFIAADEGRAVMTSYGFGP